MTVIGKEHRLKTKCELNMTPMIDCIFQLLIFFMVGMKFRQVDRRLDADLPKAGALDKQPDLKGELHISIRRRPDTARPEPLIVINQRAMSGWGDVYSNLYRLAQIPGQTRDPVILDPQDNALHGWVMKILDWLNYLHFSVINFKQ